MPAEYKDAIGSCIGDFIKLYLSVLSEQEFNKSLLASIIQDVEKSNILVDGLYSGFDIVSDIPIVKNVISVIAKAGLLENNNVKSGLLTNNFLLITK